MIGHQNAVLLVEDDEGTAELERRALSKSGLDVYVVGRVSDALAILQRRSFAAILLDYHLPDGDPWAVVEMAKSKIPRIPVVIVTSMGSERVAAEAIHRGASEYVRKTETFWDQLPNVVERVARLAQAEERLRRVDALFQLIADNASDLITTADASGIIRYVSPACRKMLGYEPEELVGSTSLELVHPDDRAGSVVSRVLGTEATHLRGTYRCQRKGGGVVWVESSAHVVRDPGTGVVTELIEITRDVTERVHAENAIRLAHDELELRVRERTSELSDANVVLRQEIAERQRAEEALRRSEEQLRQSQKMDAVGRLAGGMAHDFNNMLSVVLSYASLILMDLPPDDPVRADVQEIERASQRSAELTRQLLVFSRQQLLVPVILDLNGVVSRMENMLRRLLGADIELVILTSSALASVKADPSQIEQVVMNLAVNARDAMPRGGKLTIETRDIHVDEDGAGTRAGGQPGAHVVLAITDTGVGMDKETKNRIFEPFFTTKEPGKGTGLGLATVFGIVQQSGGHILVRSDPGQGSSFEAYFPATEAPPDAVASSPEVGVDTRGTETILLVEDDAQVRAVSLNILRRNGYQVLPAQNAGEALLICERHSGKIELLLTDVVLPHMSGPDLVYRLRSLRPEIRVLFMSGYTGEAIAHHGVLDSRLPFLQKPFTPSSLARKIREILESPADPSAGTPTRHEAG